ncbi:MAG: TonB-dependent receptor [Gemmatimonadetes bacterium]|nr:TonB-dependent receptor [Gemmatimonadota bacterium]
MFDLITKRVVFLLALSGLLAVPAPAQQSAGITGTVRAQSGLGLAGVTVRFEPTGSTAISDARGRFQLQVPPALEGMVLFAREGFQGERITVPGLAPGGSRQIAVTLTPFFVLDAVSVTAARERPLLNTRDASTGGTVERLELESLPSDARNPLLLAFNVPGVAQSTGFFGDAPPLSINASNSLYTQYSVDGLDNNEGFLGGPRVEFPLAATRRLEVLANTYSAEFGRSSNGVVNQESRAGGGEWTGELFGFGRPGAPLDATPRGVRREVFRDQDFHRYQAGGALGGPLVQGRTFVFGALEFTDERENRILSTARAAFTGSETRTTWKGFLRLDHGWNPEQTTTLRFAGSDVNRAGNGSGVVVPEADVTTVRQGTITALTHRSALRRGQASNTLSAQLGTFRWDFPPTESDLNTPQVTVVAPDRTTVQAVVGSSNFVFDEREMQLQLRDVLEAHWGDAHLLRAGADVSRSWFALDGAGTNPRGAYTVVNDGRIVASAGPLSIRDVPNDVEVVRYTVDARPQEVDLTQTTWGAFVEDRWRVSPALTVNLGLRWDYDDITSRGESGADLDNFQPRAAFNWYATPRSVLRGGAGMYTGKLPYAVYSDAVQFGPEGNAVVTFESTKDRPIGFGQGPTPEQIQIDPKAFPPREIRRTFARGLEQPESYQATVGYQRQLGERWSVAVDGVWMRTLHLPRSWDLNALERPLTPADTVDRAPSAGDAFRPVAPQPGSFRRLTTTDTGGRAEYLGLYSNIRSAVTRRFTLDGTWVWSRARNDTEDINFNATSGNDFDAEWADAINDRRHRLTLRSFYTLAERLRLAVVGDYQTGTPINRVAYFRDLDGSGIIFGNGFVGNHDRFPGVGRNAERLPDAFRLDASAAFILPLRSGAVDARVDVFNAFNSTLRTGFANGLPGGGPRTQVGRPGDPIVYTTAAPPRQVQLSLRYSF